MYNVYSFQSVADEGKSEGEKGDNGMEVSQTVDVTSEETESDDSSNSSKSGKKQRVGFRDRKIIDYENRIRTYSTPDKIFRYFATFQSIHSGEVRFGNQNY